MTPFNSSYYLTQLQTITTQIVDYEYKMESAQNDTDRYEVQKEIDGLMKKYKFFEEKYNQALNEESGTSNKMGYVPRYEYGI